MNNKCMNEIEKEDKKAFKSFVVILTISTIIGGFIGAMHGNLKQILGKNVSNLLVNILGEIAPFSSIVLSILMIIVSKIIYTNSRKGHDLWKQSNKDDNSIEIENN